MKKNQADDRARRIAALTIKAAQEREDIAAAYARLCAPLDFNRAFAGLGRSLRSHPMITAVSLPCWLAAWVASSSKEQFSSRPSGASHYRCGRGGKIARTRELAWFVPAVSLGSCSVEFPWIGGAAQNPGVPADRLHDAERGLLPQNMAALL
jgi:hypothetical protein